MSRLAALSLPRARSHARTRTTRPTCLHEHAHAHTAPPRTHTLTPSPLSPLAVAGTKRVLLRVRDSGSVADNLDYVATWNAAQLITEDVVEAAAAARERRRPVYKGLRRSKL